MRKLALLLGSLVVVASASAKEVVPAPVVVEEAPVQIVEKEVIVYRDKEEGFRPNGYVDLQYKYYGKTENHDAWGSTNGGTTRTQLEGKIQMTEKQALDFRVRDFNSVEKGSDVNKEANLYAPNEEDRKSASDTTQVRLRYYYDHGTLGDSKVGTESFVRYEKAGAQEVEYRFNFQLADYLFNNDFVKTTNFVVGPRVMYNWDNTNDDAYTATLGLYVDIVNEHPWGFSTEIEIDGLHYNMYGDAVNKLGEHYRPNDGLKADGTEDYKDNDVSLAVAAKLLHNANLYSTERVSLDWAFEGGYDPYTWYSIDRLAGDKAGHYMNEKYELYAQPTVTLTYQATEFVSLYATAGAEYRNWNIKNESSASHWRWQPFGVVGFRTTF